MWDRWKTLDINGYRCAILSFEHGSDYGIDNGRISKLEIRKGGEILVNYDRGWDIKPCDVKVKAVYEELLKMYN